MASRKRAIIAIVDKDQAVRQAIARLLSLLNYDVKSYALPEEFLTAAPTSDVQCLLVDIAPADMSGLEMVRELADMGFKSPVIFMTGTGSDVIRAQAKALNCSDYLLKPISVAELIASIEWATGLSSRIG